MMDRLPGWWAGRTKGEKVLIPAAVAVLAISAALSLGTVPSLTSQRGPFTDRAAASTASVLTQKISTAEHTAATERQYAAQVTVLEQELQRRRARLLKAKSVDEARWRVMDDFSRLLGESGLRVKRKSLLSPSIQDSPSGLFDAGARAELIGRPEQLARFIQAIGKLPYELRVTGIDSASRQEDVANEGELTLTMDVVAFGTTH